MKPIRNWRVIPAQDQGGVFVFFDPSIELLELRDLREEEKSAKVDRSVSVSGLVEVEDSKIYQLELGLPELVREALLPF